MLPDLSTNFWPLTQHPPGAEDPAVDVFCARAIKAPHARCADLYVKATHIAHSHDRPDPTRCLVTTRPPVGLLFDRLWELGWYVHERTR